ncbi:aldehyde dehydrogenase family protein [Bacillus sp. JJ722]|uniref:aldehyde dehydrogenase family protein n=1 Tax=Bacillus sp. JJ722 TaxID=3122973 RepID=UPI003000E511
MGVNIIVEELAKKSRVALKALESYTQEQVDEMCKAIALAIADHAEELAIEAVKETGMGNYKDKIVKNIEIGQGIWTTMKNKKSVGIIDRDEEKELMHVAHPKGVIACVIPTTNPTLTALGNAMLAIKGRNTVIISPHPRAKNVSVHTVEIMNEALRKLGAPENVIQIIEEPSIEHTQALMKVANIVVATGGSAMVNAANSSGKPAFGVGQGNVQVIVGDDYHDFDKVAKNIVESRSFDDGLICAGEQSIIVPKNNEQEMIAALERNGAYYSADDEIIEKFKNVIFVDGHLSPTIIGKNAEMIADLAGVKVPEETKVIVLKAHKFGQEEMLCGEKLSPIIAELTYDTFEEAVDMAKTNLLYQGAGHTTVLYSNDQKYIDYAGVTLPVSRLLINLPGLAATGVGMTSHLNPTSSIGCGSWGNNSISENLTYKHLINISTIASPRKGKPLTAEEIWSK